MTTGIQVVTTNTTPIVCEDLTRALTTASSNADVLIGINTPAGFITKDEALKRAAKRSRSNGQDTSSTPNCLIKLTNDGTTHHVDKAVAQKILKTLRPTDLELFEVDGLDCTNRMRGKLAAREQNDDDDDKSPDITDEQIEALRASSDDDNENRLSDTGDGETGAHTPSRTQKRDVSEQGRHETNSQSGVERSVANHGTAERQDQTPPHETSDQGGVEQPNDQTAGINNLIAGAASSETGSVGDLISNALDTQTLMPDSGRHNGRIVLADLIRDKTRDGRAYKRLDIAAVTESGSAKPSGMQLLVEPPAEQPGEPDWLAKNRTTHPIIFATLVKMADLKPGPQGEQFQGLAKRISDALVGLDVGVDVWSDPRKGKSGLNGIGEPYTDAELARSRGRG